MNTITLPTGRTINADEFEWRRLVNQTNTTRDFGVFYGQADLTDYLSPSQLKLIPGYDADAVSLWFYRLHHQVTLQSEPQPDDHEWTLSNAADFWEYQAGELLLTADEILANAQNFTSEQVQSAQEFVKGMTSPENLQNYKMALSKAFRKVISAVPGMDLYFTAKDISEKATSVFKTVALLGLVAYLYNTYERETR